ncbi:MAG TPA: SDR family NAD(P)-dependent oxidoreductase [Polyangiaceae bacterium]
MPTAVVTGTDVGLGRAFVDVLSRGGFRVFAGSHGLATGRDEGLSGAAEKSPEVTELALDVTDLRVVRRFVDAVAEQAAGVDLLVNNAAVNPEKGVPLEDLDFDVLTRVLDVNALGPLRMTQALLPLLERGSKKTILNVSSEAGSLASCERTSWFGYCMSKAALNIQTRLLDNALKERGFRVLSVHPGWLRTPMANFEGPVLPEDAARNIARLVLEARDETPQFFQNDGSAYPW